MVFFRQRTTNTTQSPGTAAPQRLGRNTQSSESSKSNPKSQSSDPESQSKQFSQSPHQTTPEKVMGWSGARHLPDESPILLHGQPEPQPEPQPTTIASNRFFVIISVAATNILHLVEEPNPNFIVESKQPKAWTATTTIPGTPGQHH